MLINIKYLWLCINDSVLDENVCFDMWAEGTFHWQPEPSQGQTSHADMDNYRAVAAVSNTDFWRECSLFSNGESLYEHVETSHADMNNYRAAAAVNDTDFWR